MANRTQRRRRRKRGGNHRASTSKWRPVRCSPEAKRRAFRRDSCLATDQLLSMREKWNMRHPQRALASTDPSDIYAFFQKELRTACDRESCWIRKHYQLFGEDAAWSREQSEELFAPSHPPSWLSNPHEWLSNHDLEKVMQQYEDEYPCFSFIGPTPIDFDQRISSRGECVWDELCQFRLSSFLKRGKKKIGIIFNTDPHDAPGEHWISLFIHLPKRTIFFFDSTGDPPPPEILALVERIQTQGKQQRPPLRLRFDTNEGVTHQHGDTECGVYALYFLIHMLEDRINGEYLKTHYLSDDYIHQFRRIYFNEP